MTLAGAPAAPTPLEPPDGGETVARERSAPSVVWRRLRFFGSWAVALLLVFVALPRAIDVSWNGVVVVLGSVWWVDVVGLVGLWLAGLVVYSVALKAAAPALTHRRALVLNLTGSAVANVVPLGGAAGVELNRRMMKAWGIDTLAFGGYTFLTNLWNVASKLLLPVVGLIALASVGESSTTNVLVLSLIALVAFVGLVLGAAALLTDRRGVDALGRGLERMAHAVLRRVGRDRDIRLRQALADLRGDCAGLVARGWAALTAGTGGYVALQALLLGLCLHMAGAGVEWYHVLVGFAIERLLTVVPITPGGIGVADLGLAGVLLAFGGDPQGVAASVVLYRTFIFAIEIPIGGGVLGVWLLRQRRSRRRQLVPAPGTAGRVAHVTDVFLPRLGGIETHVDDLVRHQRAAGLEAEVVTPADSSTPDPAWVRRLTVFQARRAVTDYGAVHVHLSLWSPFGVAVARAALAAGVPTLITVHSIWSGPPLLLRPIVLGALRRQPVTWSAVSAVARDSFQRALPGTPVALLPDAIDVPSWRSAAPPVARSAGRPADQPITLVSVMRFMPRKRPLPLLRMFEEVRRLTPQRDVRLVIVGDGPLRRRAERYVRRHGLGQSVRITGRVPRSRVRDELAAASLYVAPAPRESFGIAVLEARAAGLPVVANRRSGVGEFIRDGVEGSLAADDAGMVAAIAKLVDDDALREAMAAHNRRQAPRFDWSDILPLAEKLYRQAAQHIEAPALATPRADSATVGSLARGTVLTAPLAAATTVGSLTRDTVLATPRAASTTVGSLARDTVLTSAPTI